jgi:hypothetical protein
MLTRILAGAGLAAAIAFTAQAQSMPDAAQSAGQPAAGYAPSDRAASAATPRPGAVVKDANGQTVGTITQVGQTSAGESAVVVQVDGQPFTLAANVLSPAQGGFVSTMTKAQIKAAARAAPQ